MAANTRLKAGTSTPYCTWSAAATAGCDIAPAYGMMSSLGSGMQALSMAIRSATPR
jgi:hypothetical protein